MSPNKKIYEEVLKWTFSYGLDKYHILLTKKFLYISYDLKTFYKV